jgi:hypothetical protein
MMNLLYFFLVIALLKLLINAWKYIQCKHYLGKYLKWVANPTWDLVEHRSRVIRLLQDAGVQDSYRGVSEPVGYMQIRTGDASVMANFPSRREDFFVVMKGMFHQANGVYRSRILETFNPLYWVEFVINLPGQILGYLGVSPESLLTKIFQLIYWLVGGLLGFLLALYRSEIETMARDLIRKLMP